ncbi:glyoxalase [Rhodococcoides fascians]|uniref:VOC family protein n=1 Tax=Rhodococcoides fascians TaxID=1828 RepID=UPI000B9C2A55|nr:VOC family protein [Rhodococcus fascians]OZE88768.1 glyoxalase [Rhodococcus fascians]OZF16729.1 glyoxalase [Rhodococcus fascians]OZF19748.1 glyoxalase [Rhodococcus fascians]OZF66012.1 glyoxalase [Rhodococcus fascians]OZF69165.1 glyoxalase [Rhodococcus fascians]
MTLTMKIELITVPVTDVDRAKEFYTSIGFDADHDARPWEGIRYVQLTPPGSACSIAIGEGITDAEPGAGAGILMVVDSTQEAYDHLTAVGLTVEQPKDEGWGTFVYFADPDGNKWSLQQLPAQP